MAVIHLDEREDNIETVLSSLLDGVAVASPRYRNVGTSGDPLASSTWDEVPLEETHITHVQCKSLWRQFRMETEYTITQALSAQILYDLTVWFCRLLKVIDRFQERGEAHLVCYIARSRFIDGVYFNYGNYTVVINGVSYEVHAVPEAIKYELDHEQDMELIYLQIAHDLELERQEQTRIRAIEERERIVGFAATMSKILHRKKEASNKKRKRDDSSSS
ncbi:hypothetical protein POM88_024738 [Heracleum sosnowskyi]|uniref:Sey1/RHD3-like three-helix bundle domain-containing protein n=1 Tax=Heracleum sosnowskyi TaxID=360622 RepID=A0AAD8I2L8_9APIA|nr:hypothetical protein POM88_024738 [Heracleum sosnowskyi]